MVRVPLLFILYSFKEFEMAFIQNLILNHSLLLDAAAAAAKLFQACPTLCDPIDGSPLGTSVPGILQARTVEWVAISFSNAWKWKVKVKSLSHAQLLATPWTAAHQAPPSMGFSRQEYWSGVPLPEFPSNVAILLSLFLTEGSSCSQESLNVCRGVGEGF